MTWLRKWKKQKSENRCIYTSEMIFIKQNYFPHPNKSDLKKLTGNSCTGIAYQLEINSYSEDDFGNLSLEMAIFILNELAKNMKNNETLAEYFGRKRIYKREKNFYENRTS